jgi:hypothetical protein
MLTVNSIKWNVGRINLATGRMRPG